MDESNDRASVGSSSAGGVRRARPRGGAARHSAARHGARLRPCASTARGHQLGNKPDRRENRPTEPRPPQQSNSAGRWAHACKLEQRPFVRSRPSCSRSIEQVPAKLRARHGRATRPRPRAGARSRGGGGACPAAAPRTPASGCRAGTRCSRRSSRMAAGRRGGAPRSWPPCPRRPRPRRRCARARRIPNRAAFASSRRVRSRTRSRLTAGGAGSAVGAAATATSAAAATARGMGQRDVASGGLAGAA